MCFSAESACDGNHGLTSVTGGVTSIELVPLSRNGISACSLFVRHVGARVRMRRILMTMSQEKLGEALGVGVVDWAWSAAANWPRPMA